MAILTNMLVCYKRVFSCMVVMATVVVGCMCVQITIVEGTGIKQIQPKSGLLPEAIITCC